MKNIIGILQIVVSILLIIVIIFQQRGSGIGGAFGGGGGDEVFRGRRGLDNILHKTTIVLSVLFFLLSIAIFLVD
jgi:preprotein translocase subunit SecG